MTTEPADASGPAHPLDPVDAALVAGLAADLDTGFAEVVGEYQRMVFAIVRSVVAGHAEAEELSAEVFLRAYRALRGYSAERVADLRLRPWIVTIARNTMRNLLRSRSRAPRFLPLVDTEGEHTQAFVATDATSIVDDRSSLASWMAELPDAQRVAVVLHHACGLSHAEIAETLGCAEGTARSHVSRGLAALRLISAHTVDGAAGDADITRGTTP